MAKTLNKKKVVIGISGGADSAVCLKLLLERGFEAIAVYIKMARYAGDTEDDISSARKVAKLFKARFEVLDARDLFCDKIVSYYDKQIKAGKTPSPCVFCNPKVKIATLSKYADKVGAYYVATGHYARIEKHGDLLFLKKAKDRSKDQTYSLCFLSQKQLARLITPLGNFIKKDILKTLQNTKGLEYLSSKKQSQDFCYLGNLDQGQYCSRRFLPSKGGVVGNKGEMVGFHNGIYRFTIGQRKGIGLPGGPYYVTGKDAKKNRIIISSDERDLLKNRISVSPYNIIGPKLTDGMMVSAKLRSSQKLSKAKIELKQKSLILNFEKPQRAITPGQVAVFYKGEVCLGGGVIHS